ncbi:MAG: hypothetical protein ABFC57_04160 [Veillonellales bacterium]
MELGTWDLAVGTGDWNCHCGRQRGNLTVSIVSHGFVSAAAKAARRYRPTRENLAVDS